MKLSDWKQTTWYLVFCCMIFNWGNILFGVDVATFGGLQALPSWLNTFGSGGPNGRYLPTDRRSIMNSVVWIGKIVGTAMFEPLLERFGFRITIYVGAIIQIVGIIIEISAGEWVQFTVGRVLTYTAVGIVETTVPTYEAELAPAALRGFFAGNVQVFVHIGAIWGSSMSRAFAYEQGRVGWMVPVGVQMIPAVILLILVPLCVESPRWLILHGQKSRAIAALERLRPQSLDGVDRIALEANAIEEAIVESRKIRPCSWADLFRKSHSRRTYICAMMFFFNQTTGQQFAKVYGATFFASMGLSVERVFNYTILIPVVGLCACTLAICLTDTIGRRPLCYIGAALATMFSCLIATIGSRPNANIDMTYSNIVIASVIMLNGACKFGVSSQCYLVASEIGGTQMRKKMLAWAAINDTIYAFIVTFCVPYLLDGPTIQLGPRVGFVFMGLAALAFFWFILSLPELKGRSLEEVDELFEQRLWAWQFSRAKTTGVGTALTLIESRPEMTPGVMGKPGLEGSTDLLQDSAWKQSRA